MTARPTCTDLCSRACPTPSLRSHQFDVVVIGGGIIGCGIARDAALRGLKVALVEKHDFGSGTTAGSTRLIHGGLRYLATDDFGLVRMDLRERETLLRIAPHLVKPLPFLLPLPKGFYGRTRLRIGMHLYDALSYDKTLPSHRILAPTNCAASSPRSTARASTAPRCSTTASAPRRSA